MMADVKFGFGVLKREDESLKDYLLSFSPFAPFFGVPYRFAGTGFEGFAPATPVAPAPAAAPKPKARKAKAAPVEEAVEAPVAETIAETIAATEAAVEPVATATAEIVEAAADAILEGKPALLYDVAPQAADDLKAIRGIGPKLERELNGMGVYTYAQVASMSAANLAWIDSNLTAFRGRSVRDDWVGQATALLGS